MRSAKMGEGLTMLIGRAPDGALLKGGVLGFDGDDPVIIKCHAVAREVRRFLG